MTDSEVNKKVDSSLILVVDFAGSIVRVLLFFDCDDDDVVVVLMVC